METEHSRQEHETNLENFHYISAVSLEDAYHLFLGKETIVTLKEISKRTVAFLYDIDGVFTDGTLRDVLFQSLYQEHLVTLSCFVKTFPRAAHIVYTSRPQVLDRFGKWIQPLKEALAALPRSQPNHVEVIPFTPEKEEESLSKLRTVLENESERFAINTDLAKEGSTKFIARIMGIRSKETRDSDILTPMLKTIAKKHKTIIIFDNDDTILEQITQFAQSNSDVQIYYISIPTNTYLTAVRGWKKRYDAWKESRKKEDNT